MGRKRENENVERCRCWLIRVVGTHASASAKTNPLAVNADWAINQLGGKSTLTVSPPPAWPRSFFSPARRGFGSPLIPVGARIPIQDVAPIKVPEGSWSPGPPRVIHLNIPGGGRTTNYSHETFARQPKASSGSSQAYLYWEISLLPSLSLTPLPAPPLLAPLSVHDHSVFLLSSALGSPPLPPFRTVSSLTF